MYTKKVPDCFKFLFFFLSYLTFSMFIFTVVSHLLNCCGVGKEVRVSSLIVYICI